MSDIDIPVPDPEKAYPRALPNPTRDACSCGQCADNMNAKASDARDDKNAKPNAKTAEASDCAILHSRGRGKLRYIPMHPKDSEGSLGTFVTLEPQRPQKRHLSHMEFIMQQKERASWVAFVFLITLWIVSVALLAVVAWTAGANSTKNACDAVGEHTLAMCRNVCHGLTKRCLIQHPW